MHKQTVMEHTEKHRLVCDHKVSTSLCTDGENNGEKNHSLKFPCFVVLNEKWNYCTNTLWMCDCELQF